MLLCSHTLWAKNLEREQWEWVLFTQNIWAYAERTQGWGDSQARSVWQTKCVQTQILVSGNPNPTIEPAILWSGAFQGKLSLDGVCGWGHHTEISVPWKSGRAWSWRYKVWQKEAICQPGGGTSADTRSTRTLILDSRAAETGICYFVMLPDRGVLVTAAQMD